MKLNVHWTWHSNYMFESLWEMLSIAFSLLHSAVRVCWRAVYGGTVVHHFNGMRGPCAPRNLCTIEVRCTPWSPSVCDQISGTSMQRSILGAQLCWVQQRRVIISPWCLSVVEWSRGCGGSAFNVERAPGPYFIRWTKKIRCWHVLSFSFSWKRFNVLFPGLHLLYVC